MSNNHLSTSEMETFLKETLEKALKRGADAADVLYVQGTSLTLACRNGQKEHLERSEGNDLGIRVFIGKRQAVVSTSDFSPKTLSNLLDQAISMAKTVPEDPFCGLAPKEDLASGFENIDSFDPSEDNEAVLSERALLCEKSALAVEGVIMSEGVEASWGKSHLMLATSTGFCGNYRDSSRSLSVAVVAGIKGQMERDYDATMAIYLEDMKKPEEIGHSAGERAVRRLNPRKIVSMSVPIVFDPRVSSSLLGHLAGAINGGSVVRGTSFLKDKMNHSLFPKNITIMDDPYIKRGFRSRPFDAEGIAAKPSAIVEEGILKSWILDLRTARSLGMKSTGHASRGTGGIPHPAVSNFFMKPGITLPQDLIKSLSKGFYVTELIGQGVNLVTGDYSRGAQGFWIENGEITYAVSEVVIAGNLLDIFSNIYPCSDLEFRFGIDAPTLMVEGMTIAGK